MELFIGVGPAQRDPNHWEVPRCSQRQMSHDRLKGNLMKKILASPGPSARRERTTWLG